LTSKTSTNASSATNVLKRGFADTAGYKFVKIFATPGWRITSICYSRQYELGLGWPESTPVETVTATDTDDFQEVSASHVVEAGSLPS